MPAERYFIDDSLDSRKQLEIKDSEFHHLAHVMRTKKGDAIELVNGKGALAIGSVIEVAKDKAKIMIESFQTIPHPPNFIILAQAFCKQNRMDILLEKGTELGVNQFWLFPGHHSDKKECFPSQMERNHALIISAMKQSGRLFLPEIAYKEKLDTWQKTETAHFFYGDLNAEAPLFENEWKQLANKDRPVVFFTGPEGGFSQQEEVILQQLGAHGVKLHSNILRSETASIMAISLISHWHLQ